jgi:hypothetical protein
MMSMTKILMLAATLTVGAGAAIAAPAERMSDVQFLLLNRCAGLVSAERLGGGDVKVAETLIREQSRGREPYIMDRANEMRDDAARAARGASGDYRVRLIAERDGVCQRLAPNSTTTTMAHGPTGAATPSTN